VKIQTLERIQAAVQWYSTVPPDFNDIVKTHFPEVTKMVEKTEPGIFPAKTVNATVKARRDAGM